jgi:CubicO group peptidase (beta-lactamase class C family)
MIERGEMNLDDPVQKYLPASVTMPTRHGRQIALLHLVTHTSGLPHIAENLNPKRPENIFADYSVEELNSQGPRVRVRFFRQPGYRPVITPPSGSGA